MTKETSTISSVTAVKTTSIAWALEICLFVIIMTPHRYLILLIQLDDSDIETIVVVKEKWSLKYSKDSYKRSVRRLRTLGELNTRLA